MSKAVTQYEVEDVLSSIRRLASEDKRPLAGLRDPAAAAAHDEALQEEGSAADADTAPEAVKRFSDDYARAEQDQQVQTAADAPTDRFVLTLSLRVVDDAPKGEEPLDLGSVARETWTAEAPVEEATVEDAKAYQGPMVLFPAAQDSVPQEDRDAAMEALDALVHETIESDDAPEAADAEPEAEPEAAGASMMPLTAKIAALEAAVGKIAEGWEPDGDEAVELAATQMSTMAWEDDVELDAKGAPFTGAEHDALPQEAAHYDEFARDEANEADKPSMAAAFGGDDQLMDEETLRELVSEIVRAELQGDLGERITRNVRKLVRREIHRALTAHEME